MKRSRALLIGLLVCSCGSLAIAGLATNTAPGPLRTLLVGGGPDLKHNQVAIESNVRYVDRSLPAGTPRIVLFTNGETDSKNVLYLDENNKEAYRAPQLPRLDGPSELTRIQSEIATLAKDSLSSPAAPVLLYFTGHGSPVPSSEFTNNKYDLWNGGALTVTDLATSLKAFPKTTPVTLLMVECFSGAFGNVLFDDADPTGKLADRKVCGFFASIPTREAAGCTPEVNEANYRDFTSYFVAALTGTDRLGKPVSGADYNRDGKVGMNEAFCYSLIHDDSIDTPVCTSDVFLRRFIKTADPDIFLNRYDKVRGWGTPAQTAVLDELSASLGLTGDERGQKAYDTFYAMNKASFELRDVRMIRFVRLYKSVVLGHSMMDSSDRELKRHFTDLIQLESGNVFKS